MFDALFFRKISLKQCWMPFCAFFTTFTFVMTILFLSTDLRTDRHYIHFNSTILWDFEENTQESPSLIHLIQKHYIKSPNLEANTSLSSLILKPSKVLLNILKKKKKGIYMECGAGLISDTFWLENTLGWRGLLTQPHPKEYLSLTGSGRKRSHTAQVCISPTVYPRHAFFKDADSKNDSLTPIPCFPLYSLMRAYNVTNFDLLILNDVNAPFQVLKTLPFARVQIGIIGLVLHEADSDDGSDGSPLDICCSSTLTEHLVRMGYRKAFSCPISVTSCYFKCSGFYCPL